MTACFVDARVVVFCVFRVCAAYLAWTDGIPLACVVGFHGRVSGLEQARVQMCSAALRSAFVLPS